MSAESWLRRLRGAEAPPAWVRNVNADLAASAPEGTHAAVARQAEDEAIRHLESLPPLSPVPPPADPAVLAYGVWVFPSPDGARFEKAAAGLTHTTPMTWEAAEAERVQWGRSPFEGLRAVVVEVREVSR